jgi:hypothetical protein
LKQKISPRERLFEKAQNPTVRRVMELFDAHPVRVEEAGKD